jgi:hypothetical protein
MTGKEIITALERQEADSAAYWNAFDEATFFKKIGTGWSPADTVRHLAKSNRPVAKALRYPKILLRILFGAAPRPSISYEELVANYRKKLSEGGQAGSFAPSSSEKDRATIMGDFTSTQRDLRANISRWSDKQLDRLQMPHPLLGKLTVREILLFTLYHQRHHVDAINRRLAELQHV